jgi:predicted acylesterase/phospholipase RssA
MTKKVLEKNAKGKKALVIGGGAPNSSLIAGALVAFLERGIEFDVISTSGAGALMGLLYVAPRGGDAKTALQKWGSGGVDNAIYDKLPVNFKVFMKPGPAAEAYRSMLLANPFTAPYVDMFAENAVEGLWGDIVRFWLATLSPSDLKSSDLGLCAHLPFAEQAIDFKALKKARPQFFVNAYNLSKGKMAIWEKEVITPDHIKASFAFPFIYPPYPLDGDDYIEGASVDSLNFEALVSDDEDTPGVACDIDTIIVFDILGDKKLITKPTSLYDSWVNSIIAPLVQLARDDLRLFELVHNRDKETGLPKRNLLKVPLCKNIPDEHWPKVLDWSFSNVKILYDLGYKAGLEFCDAHSDILTVSSAPKKVA